MPRASSVPVIVAYGAEQHAAGLAEIAEALHVMAAVEQVVLPGARVGDSSGADDLTVVGRVARAAVVLEVAAAGKGGSSRLVEETRAIAARNPQSVDLQVYFAQLLMATGDSAGARKVLDAALPWRPRVRRSDYHGVGTVQKQFPLARKMRRSVFLILLKTKYLYMAA
jgi:hypothetical protein